MGYSLGKKRLRLSGSRWERPGFSGPGIKSSGSIIIVLRAQVLDFCLGKFSEICLRFLRGQMSMSTPEYSSLFMCLCSSGGRKGTKDHSYSNDTFSTRQAPWGGKDLVSGWSSSYPSQPDRPGEGPRTLRMDREMAQSPWKDDQHQIAPWLLHPFLILLHPRED